MEVLPLVGRQYPPSKVCFFLPLLLYLSVPSLFSDESIPLLYNSTLPFLSSMAGLVQKMSDSVQSPPKKGPDVLNRDDALTQWTFSRGRFHIPLGGESRTRSKH